jgi:uncharacterized protein YqeY
MLRARFNDELKAAMKAKDPRAVSTVRLILAALKDRDIAARSRGITEGIGDDEIGDLLQKMIRQRRESIELYQQGKREDLAQQEREEIAIIERFLPQQMSESETAAAVSALIDELGAGSIKDMGRVMAALKQRHAGQMDFSKASALVKERLS